MGESNGSSWEKSQTPGLVSGSLRGDQLHAGVLRLKRSQSRQGLRRLVEELIAPTDQLK